MTGQNVTTKENKSPIALLQGDMAKRKRQLESMLPAGLEVNKFMRTVVNGISTHKQSDKILGSDRQSLFSACQKAAADGLLLDGREATLVVFYNKDKKVNEVQYMPMTQGLIKLARNSGKISNIIAEVVYKNDDFEYRPGIDDMPVFKPDWFGERGEPVGVYAVILQQDGDPIVRVLSKARVLQIGSSGQNAKQYDPKNGQHYAEWWRKTAIKNVLKYAPSSSSLDQAIDYDNEREGFDYDAAEETGRAPVTASDINADLEGEVVPEEAELKEVIDTETGEVMSENPAPQDEDIV